MPPCIIQDEENVLKYVHVRHNWKKFSNFVGSFFGIEIKLFECWPAHVICLYAMVLKNVLKYDIRHSWKFCVHILTIEIQGFLCIEKLFHFSDNWYNSMTLIQTRPKCQARPLKKKTRSLDKAVYKWLLTVRSKNAFVNTLMLKEKASFLAKAFGITDFAPSDG